MGLSSSLQIGRTALTASQLAIQVTGNNFANASTPGYSRQVVDLAAFPDQGWGRFQLGRGVDVAGIRRNTDAALQNRLWNSNSQEGAAALNQQVLAQLEGTINDLDTNGLSAQFARFFNAWNELSNSPNRDGARSLVVQQGRALAGGIRALRTDLQNIQRQTDAQLDANVSRADTLLSQIADINVRVTGAEGGAAGQAAALRDQRDQLVTELSRLIDVTVIEQPSGGINVLAGSTPLVLESVSRGIEVQRTINNGVETVSVNVKADSTQLNPQGGAISGLINQRIGASQNVIDNLDKITAQLIFEVNKLHSVGTGSVRLQSVTGTLRMPTADFTRPLNDPANTTLSNLPFKPVNGGFLVTVTNASTGASQTVRVRVDLDGVTNAGTPGTADDSSASSIAADIDAIPNLNASIQPDGTLKIDAATGYSVSFGEDTSAVLAVLGINTYFTGSSAADIDVRTILTSQPGLLATGATVGGQPVDNATALGISRLKDQQLTALGGTSIVGAWRDVAQDVGNQAAQATSRTDAATVVRENLDAQRAAISGVDLDEEAINLLNYQRMYQGAARFITVVDELTQTLLGLVQ